MTHAEQYYKDRGPIAYQVAIEVLDSQEESLKDSIFQTALENGLYIGRKDLDPEVYDGASWALVSKAKFKDQNPGAF